MSASTRLLRIQSRFHAGWESRALCLICCALLLPLATRAEDPAPTPALRVLIVGGGPDLENNQVAIESNVRYIGRLLPANAIRTTLFADGDPNHATVLFDDDTSQLSTGRQILNLALYGYDSDAADPSHYRKPNLGARLDGASRSGEVDRALAQIDQEAENGAAWHDLMLYFTGHGSTNRGDQENNQYDLWGGEGLTVKQLARRIARLPDNVPVTVVMVQCFSGAFGNLIFEDGEPMGKPVGRDFAGFFATVKDRVAAGCTSAINEADYHDFTSYFFAALTGRDRVGRRVTGADYNGDGRVGMDEAYCYSLVHDESIDVPVCTSDVLLRRYALLDDAHVFRITYSRLRGWATPAQQAALDGLSDRLHLSGDDRPAVSFRKLTDGSNDSQLSRAQDREDQALGHFNGLRNETRRILVRRYPELAMTRSTKRSVVEETTATTLTQEADAGKWHELLDAADDVSRAEQGREAAEIAESHLIRFVRLCKSVVLAHQLEQTGSAAVKTRLARLQEAEQRTLLPPADTVARTTPVQP